MTITPKCDRCSEELQEFGAILLGPPDEQDMAKKLHLCKPCYEKIIKEIEAS